MELPDVERVSDLVHEAWMDGKRAKGVSSRKSENGEELMVPYEQLSEPQKDQDRSTVKAVYAAIRSCQGSSQPAGETTVPAGKPPPGGFACDDRVEWTSQSQSHTTTKRGTVVAVVPAGSNPTRLIPAGKRCNSKAGFGMSRNEKSYLVAVDGKGNQVYWPRACQLKPLGNLKITPACRQAVLYMASSLLKAEIKVTLSEGTMLALAELSMELKKRADAIPGGGGTEPCT